MNTAKSTLPVPELLCLILLLVLPVAEAGARGNDRDRDVHLISESAMLAGLPPNAVFPFMDTTPNTIKRAHIAITDSTGSCAAGAEATAPDSVQVLVGQAGVTLVPVMTAETNTGISTTPEQCVFHVTVIAGAGGIPAKVTDIVVLNGGGAAFTAFNTVTASAEVVRQKRKGGRHEH